jgi:chemotaxis signal transduction protein
MNQATTHLVFTIGSHHCALPVAQVERVTRAGAVRPLPGAVAPVLGVVNIQGAFLPVVGLRAWLDLPAQDLGLSDQFIVTRVGDQATVLVVSGVSGLLDCTEDVVIPGAPIVGDLRGVRGVVRQGDGVVLMLDLAALLTPVAPLPAGASLAAETL